MPFYLLTFGVVLLPVEHLKFFSDINACEQKNHYIFNY